MFSDMPEEFKRIWSHHAVNYMWEKHDDGNLGALYSLHSKTSSCLSSLMCPLLQAIDVSAPMSGLAKPKCDTDFDFMQAEDAFQRLEHEDDVVAINASGSSKFMQRKATNLVFFRVLHKDPANIKSVADLHIGGVGGLQRSLGSKPCIAPLDVLEADMGKHSFVVASESASGVSCEPSILSLKSLLPEDLLTMRRWTDETLVHRVFCDLPSECMSLASTVVSALIDAGAQPGGSPYIDEGKVHDGILGRLEEQGIVECVRSHAAHSAWLITGSGMKCIRAAFKVSVYEKAIPRSSDPLVGDPKEWSPYAVATALVNSGWQCKVKYRRNEKIEAYNEGNPKVFYIKPRDDVFNFWYLVALLTYDTHKTGVEHLKTTSYYLTLLGQQPITKRKKKSAKFEFGSFVAEKPMKKKRRLSSRSTTLRDDGHHGCDEDDSHSHSEPESSASSTGDSTSSSDSGDGDTSVDSSASSVSEKSKEEERDADNQHACSSRKEVAAKDDKKDISPLEPEVPDLASEDVKRAGHGMGGKLLDTTFYWYGFRFTQVKDKGVHCGWEVSCKSPGHYKCTRTQRFRRNFAEDGDALLSTLKWWCIEANDCENKEQHMAKPRYPVALPSEDAIEEIAKEMFVEPITHLDPRHQ